MFQGGYRKEKDSFWHEILYFRVGGLHIVKLNKP